MNIGIDAGCLGVKDERLKVGVYVFAKNLLLELSKIDKVNNYYLYSFYPIESSLMNRLGPNMKNIIVRPAKGWLKIWLPIRMTRDRVNVFLALGQAVPPRMLPTIKSIGVIYDLAYERFPKYFPDSYDQLHANTNELVKKSNHILTISESSKQDIVKFYKMNPINITVVPLGARRFPQGKEIKKVKRNPYFLYVGALKRIKNVSTLILAFDKFLSRTKDDIELLVVGGDRWIDPEINKAMSQISDETIEKISFIGYAQDNELVDMYRNAIAFVSPSHYEGFGLTFLEAMAAGCPVIASNAGAIPEVVGKSGILLKSDDVSGFAQSMVDIQRDSDLRAKLSKKGISKSTEFSWEKCAHKVFGIIQQYS